MKRATREWVDKAEGDYAVAGRELAAPSPVFDAVCFHAQQCVEKYLLIALAAMAEGVAPGISAYRVDLALLRAFAVAPRYPGASTDRADAEAAVDAARRVRDALRLALDV